MRIPTYPHSGFRSSIQTSNLSRAMDFVYRARRAWADYQSPERWRRISLPFGGTKDSSFGPNEQGPQRSIFTAHFRPYTSSTKKTTVGNDSTNGRTHNDMHLGQVRHDGAVIAAIFEGGQARRYPPTPTDSSIAQTRRASRFTSWPRALRAASY